MTGSGRIEKQRSYQKPTPFTGQPPTTYQEVVKRLLELGKGMVSGH
jgi:hypothetical protein